MIDISKLEKAAVLAALYNNAMVLGMGALQFVPGDLAIQEAEKMVEDHTYFDYVKGRVMKVDLSGDELNPRLYDRDNGEGAAQRALQPLLGV